MDFKQFLPKDEDVVESLGQEVIEMPKFQEQQTKSPGYKKVSLLPVFIIAGLRVDSLTPLMRQLNHPTFCCPLSSKVTSVQQWAEVLVQDILKIQPRGPYNIVGESWSGAVALTLSCMLEARGHQVELFLVEAVPSVTLDRIKALCKYGNVLETSVATALLDFPVENESDEEEILFDKQSYIKAKQQNGAIGKAVEVVTMVFKMLKSCKTSSIFNGQTTVITRTELSSTHLEILSKVLKQEPRLVTTGDLTYEKMLSNPTTASAINENLAFSWNLS